MCGGFASAVYWRPCPATTCLFCSCPCLAGPWMACHAVHRSPAHLMSPSGHGFFASLLDWSPWYRSTCLINSALLRFLCMPRNRPDLSAGVRSSSPSGRLIMVLARQDHAHPSAARGRGGRRPDAHNAARVARPLACRRAQLATAQGRMRPDRGRAPAARAPRAARPSAGPRRALWTLVEEGACWVVGVCLVSVA